MVEFSHDPPPYIPRLFCAWPGALLLSPSKSSPLAPFFSLVTKQSTRPVSSMERSAWPENLSSSRKHAIQDLLHDQNPTKKLRDLFDAHSQTGNNTGQPLFAEDLFFNVLRSFGNSISESMSAESDEVLQLPTNACVRSEYSEGSESIKPPIPRGTSNTWTRLDDREFVYDGYSWRKYAQEAILKSEFPRNYYGCSHKFDQGCQATKQVQKIKDDPPVYRTIYQGHHTCNPRGSSVPQSFNTSLIAEQDDDDNTDPIFFNFPLVNHEQKFPSGHDLNPHGHGHGHDDSSKNNNQSTSSDYYAPHHLIITLLPRRSKPCPHIKGM
ncbi:hypothetical protein ACJRO7_000711 [Eucalyptus globulus]|uniref:WRKY domain-containing protein n=1 Tax=Eucalyptus globulus TaxID=34317 RepID=A0ABD3LS63_EUCGL